MMFRADPARIGYSASDAPRVMREIFDAGGRVGRRTRRPGKCLPAQRQRPQSQPDHRVRRRVVTDRPVPAMRVSEGSSRPLECD